VPAAAGPGRQAGRSPKARQAPTLSATPRYVPRRLAGTPLLSSAVKHLQVGRGRLCACGRLFPRCCPLDLDPPRCAQPSPPCNAVPRKLPPAPDRHLVDDQVLEAKVGLAVAGAPVKLGSTKVKGAKPGAADLHTRQQPRRAVCRVVVAIITSGRLKAGVTMMVALQKRMSVQTGRGACSCAASGRPAACPGSHAAAMPCHASSSHPA